jgi:hypothetical protein
LGSPNQDFTSNRADFGEGTPIPILKKTSTKLGSVKYDKDAGKTRSHIGKTVGTKSKFKLDFGETVVHKELLETQNSLEVENTQAEIDAEHAVKVGDFWKEIKEENLIRTEAAREDFYAKLQAYLEPRTATQIDDNDRIFVFQGNTYNEKPKKPISKILISNQLLQLLPNSSPQMVTKISVIPHHAPACKPIVKLPTKHAQYDAGQTPSGRALQEPLKILSKNKFAQVLQYMPDRLKHRVSFCVDSKIEAKKALESKTIVVKAAAQFLLTLTIGNRIFGPKEMVQISEALDMNLKRLHKYEGKIDIFGYCAKLLGEPCISLDLCFTADKKIDKELTKDGIQKYIDPEFYFKFPDRIYMPRFPCSFQHYKEICIRSAREEKSQIQFLKNNQKKAYFNDIKKAKKIYDLRI